MKRTGMVVAALALALGACAHQAPCLTEHPRPAGKPDPARPVVEVVGGEVRIDQEAIRFRPDQKNVEIVWTLATPGYQFARKGIEFEDPNAYREFVGCHRKPSLNEFSCRNLHSRREFYKYTITVEDAKENPLPKYDPFVLND